MQDEVASRACVAPTHRHRQTPAAEGSSGVGVASRSRLRWTASATAHAQDQNLLPGNAIPDQVRPNRDQFTHLGARYSATAMRKVDQAIPGRKQRLSQARRGRRIEFMDVLVLAPHPAQCDAGPDDTHKLGFGRGDSLGLDQSPKPFMDTFMRHHPPCREVGLGLGIEARLGGLVGRQIEDRPEVCLRHAQLPIAGHMAQIRRGARANPTGRRENFEK